MSNTQRQDTVPAGAPKWETSAIAIPQGGDVAKVLSHHGKDGWEPWSLLPKDAFDNLPASCTIVGLRRPVFAVAVAGKDTRVPMWDVVVVNIFGSLTEQLNEAGKTGWSPWGILPRPAGAHGTFVGLKRQLSTLEVRRTLDDGILQFNRDKV